MGKLAEDIRLIVGVKDIENKLKTIEEKYKILSSRGVGYQQDNTVNNNKNNTGVGGSGGGGGGTGTDGGGTTVQPIDDSTHDVGDVIEGADGPGLNTPATLDGLTGLYDCETGKELEIREDGQARPPAGWSDADTGPSGHTFAGRRWPSEQGGSPGSGGWKTSVSDSAREIFIRSYNNGNIFQSGPLEGTGYDFVGVTGITEGQYTLLVRQSFDNFEPINGQISGPNILSSVCDPMTDNNCPITTGVVSDTVWPEADNFQLIRGSDGLLRPHPRDPNAPLKYQDGVSTVDFCFGDDRTGRREAATGGGFMYYETNSEGDPIGNVSVYNENRHLIARVKAADKDLYKPES